MPYTLIVENKENKKYYAYKSSYRENGKVKNNYVYLGTEEVALKLLDDFNSKKPSNERLLSSSGEKILSKVLGMLGFQDIVSNSIKNDAKLNAGRFIEMVVVERALDAFSKYGLAEHAHGHSIFSLDKNIPCDKFTDANIYHYMDYLFPNVDEIQQRLVKNLLCIEGIELNELIIDGTSVSCFGDDDTDDENDEKDAPGGTGEGGDGGKYAEVKRVHGYSRAKRPDLAQVEVMLGVNDQSIPLFFQVFPGNAPDVHMFKAILEKCQKGYSSLLSKAKNKYVVFDKGNNNPKNIKELDELCGKWNFHFVASVRPSMVAVKTELSMLAKDNAPVIYTQKKTVLRGRTTTGKLYGKARHVLLYLNEEIMKQKQDAFRQKVKEVKAEIREQAHQEGSPKAKMVKIEKILCKNGLSSFFTLQAHDDVVKCMAIKEKIEEHVNGLGKYALITNDPNLDATEMMRIYKTTGVIEQEFHVLKSELGLGPVFHRKPDRIQVHFTLILWGMMALAVPLQLHDRCPRWHRWLGSRHGTSFC